MVFQRPAEELTARLAYVGFDGAKALAASETIPLDQELPSDFLDHRLETIFPGGRGGTLWVVGLALARLLR